jgi:hypothetical protein
VVVWYFHSSNWLLIFQRMLRLQIDVLTWYKFRDMIVGANDVQQDIKRALELAAFCKYPNAVWLTKLMKWMKRTRRY